MSFNPTAADFQLEVMKQSTMKTTICKHVRTIFWMIINPTAVNFLPQEVMKEYNEDYNFYACNNLTSWIIFKPTAVHFLPEEVMRQSTIKMTISMQVIT